MDWKQVDQEWDDLRSSFWVLLENLSAARAEQGRLQVSSIPDQPLLNAIHRAENLEYQMKNMITLTLEQIRSGQTPLFKALLLQNKFSQVLTNIREEDRREAELNEKKEKSE